MSTYSFLEDAFLDFFSLAESREIYLQPQDSIPCNNFYNIVFNNKQLTENQSRYVLRILEKYKDQALGKNIDYTYLLENPIWKNSFRVIDNSKKIYIDQDESGNIWVCAKFPFLFKDKFQQEITHSGENSENIWDPEKKVRKLLLRNCNLIQIYDFCSENGFEIDETILNAVAGIEELWQNSQDIVPRSTIENGSIKLINASQEAEDWWKANSTGNIEQDMFLAKIMNYPLDIEKKSCKTDLEKICSSEKNFFWIKEHRKFFNLYKQVGGKCAVLIDRISDIKSWIENFVRSAETCGIDRQDIRVCFRETNSSENNFNEWIKQNSLGGSIDSGKIYIFQHKPPKWLFKENNSVKIIATNEIYPSTNTMTQSWLESHPCVIYLGEIKPSFQRKLTIVEL